MYGLLEGLKSYCKTPFSRCLQGWFAHRITWKQLKGKNKGATSLFQPMHFKYRRCWRLYSIHTSLYTLLFHPE